MHSSAYCSFYETHVLSSFGDCVDGHSYKIRSEENTSLHSTIEHLYKFARLPNLYKLESMKKYMQYLDQKSFNNKIILQMTWSNARYLASSPHYQYNFNHKIVCEIRCSNAQDIDMNDIKLNVNLTKIKNEYFPCKEYKVILE